MSFEFYKRDNMDAKAVFDKFAKKDNVFRYIAYDNNIGHTAEYGEGMLFPIDDVGTSLVIYKTSQERAGMPVYGVTVQNLYYNCWYKNCSEDLWNYNLYTRRLGMDYIADVARVNFERQGIRDRACFKNNPPKSSGECMNRRFKQTSLMFSQYHIAAVKYLGAPYDSFLLRDNVISDFAEVATALGLDYFYQDAEKVKNSLTYVHEYNTKPNAYGTVNGITAHMFQDKLKKAVHYLRDVLFFHVAVVDSLAASWTSTVYLQMFPGSKLYTIQVYMNPGQCGDVIGVCDDTKSATLFNTCSSINALEPEDLIRSLLKVLVTDDDDNDVYAMLSDIYEEIPLLSEESEEEKCQRVFSKLPKTTIEHENQYAIFVNGIVRWLLSTECFNNDVVMDILNILFHEGILVDAPNTMHE